MRLSRIIFLALVCLLTPLAKADLAEKLSNLVGYTVVDSKTIKAWYDEGDTEKGDGSFKGCKHGRTIIFDDNRVLKCAQYGYQYAYRPIAVILAKSTPYQGSTFYEYKMVVADEVYDMRR